jgi:hypothetical protein
VGRRCGGGGGKRGEEVGDVRCKCMWVECGACCTEMRLWMVIINDVMH